MHRGLLARMARGRTRQRHHGDRTRRPLRGGPSMRAGVKTGASALKRPSRNGPARALLEEAMSGATLAIGGRVTSRSTMLHITAQEIHARYG